jgi:hypothetical protein
MQNQSLLNIYLANISFIIIESLFNYILDILDLFSFIIISIFNLVYFYFLFYYIQYNILLELFNIYVFFF